jgi:hypothetical protein
MTTAREKLNGELAAYSPCELAEFQDTLHALLDAADNGTVGYCAIRARMNHVLCRAIEKRLKAELRAQRTAEIIPFRRPVRPNG